MIDEIYSAIPTVIDVTLYKYNYIDNRFLTLLRNQIDYKTINEDSILITKNQLSVFIDKNYKRELNRIKSNGAELFHKEVNSIFFLNQMTTDFDNLEYIKLSINKDKAYSRLVEIDGNKIIKFNYKILHGVLKLYDIFNNAELKILNRILVEMDIMKEDVPYATVDAIPFMNLIDEYIVAKKVESEELNIIQDIIDIIDQRFEIDNPKLLLVTDY